MRYTVDTDYWHIGDSIDRWAQEPIQDDLRPFISSTCCCHAAIKIARHRGSRMNASGTFSTW